MGLLFVLKAKWKFQSVMREFSSIRIQLLLIFLYKIKKEIMSTTSHSYIYTPSTPAYARKAERIVAGKVRC